MNVPDTDMPENDPADHDADAPPMAQAQAEGAEETAPREPAPRAKERLPRRRSRRVRNPFVVALSAILSLLFLFVLGAGFALYLGKVEFERRGPLETAKTVVVARGQGVQSIAQQLAREGAIDIPLLFSAGVTLYKAQDKLHAGEYELKPGVSMREIMDIMSSGKTILHGLTVPEGLTSKQVIALVNASEMLSGPLVDAVPAEGSLLPETYKFTRGTPRDQVIKRMRADLNKALEVAWQKRDPSLPLKSPAELLVLASIVEKETGIAEERPRVAAVFVNRLRKGMRLQSDPTILYGLHGGDAWTMPRTLTRSELDQPNPYNTYQIDRLPPGPIANVGVAALEAVVRPADTKDLYFVADGTGGHAFAETLAEHNKNVARWREVEKQRAQNGAAAAQSTQ